MTKEERLSFTLEEIDYDHKEAYTNSKSFIPVYEYRKELELVGEVTLPREIGVNLYSKKIIAFKNNPEDHDIPKNMGYTMHHFPRKDYGRIFVLNKEDVQRVKDIIRAIDEYEYDYMPQNFIEVYHEGASSMYTHKFDGIDLNLLQEICWSRGIPMFCHIGDRGFAI